MRRIVVTLAALLAAVPAVARQPFALDRTGVLWQASPSASGLLIEGHRDGDLVVRGFVPTAPFGGVRIVDSHVEVAVNPSGSEVVVVWQRSWGEALSEILLARWSAQGEGAVMRLSGALANAARNPTLKVQRVSWTDTDENEQPLPREETLVHVVWWEDSQWGSGARYVWLSLDTPAQEQRQPVVLVLDQVAGEAPVDECESPLSADVREHPLFASHPTPDSFSLIAASGACRLTRTDIGSQVVTPPPFGPEGGLIGSAQRRRARPIFGSRIELPPAPLSLEGMSARVGSGGTLLLYGVDREKARTEFSLLHGGRWTAPRFVPLGGHVSPEALLPILESLVH